MSKKSLPPLTPQTPKTHMATTGDHASHLEQHGHAWIPLQTDIHEQYKSIEASLALSTGAGADLTSPAPRAAKKRKIDDDDDIVIPGADKMDAKTLARAKNREQAKKSREVRGSRGVAGLLGVLELFRGPHFISSFLFQPHPYSRTGTVRPPSPPSEKETGHRRHDQRAQ